MEIFMYFWLNCFDKYCHIERIPVVVKNTDYLFGKASETFESDKLQLCLLTVLKSMIMNKVELI